MVTFSLNGQATSTQTFATGISGTDFNIVSGLGIHTFNIPDASAITRGFLTASDWSIFNGKQSALGFTPVLNSTTVNGQALTSNVTLSTADILDSLNKRYVTDAGLTVLGNTSGTNTGDESSSTIRTKLGITTLSGSNTGDVTIGTGNGLSLSGQVLSIALSGASATGTLSSLDWNTFNNKQSALGYTPLNPANNLSDITNAGTARTNLGLGSLATLSAINNSNWSGTALSNANLANSSVSFSTGTTGSDFNISGSPVSLGGTLTLNIPSASALNRGLLTALDWSTFNSKQSALGYTPLNPANNLSDLASASTARTNLGLGTLATQSGTFSGTHSGTSSGTNTGDQTTISGNAGTATSLQTARTINGVSFDGTANITVTAAAGTLTGTTLASGVINSSLTSVGTLGSLVLSGTVTGATSYNGLVVTANTGAITTGTWNGTTIAVANGGTGGANGSITGTGALSFNSNSTNALTLDSGTTGAINVGTNANAKTITIGNSTGATRANITAGTGGIFLTGLATQTNGKFTVCFDTATGQLFKGFSVSSCNSSSARYKHDIINIGLGLDAVNALRPVSFVYNSDGEKSLGFIAEEVALVDERLIVRDSDGVIQAINPDEFTPILTHAIQQVSVLMGDISPKVNADGGDNGLSTLVATIQSETAHDPIAIIAKKISGGKQFLTNFVAARITAIRGYFDEIFANKTHQKTLCVGDTDNETCITKNQLDNLLSGQNTAPAPSNNSATANNSEPTSSSTPPVVVEPTSQSLPDVTTSTATQTATDTLPTSPDLPASEAGATAPVVVEPTLVPVEPAVTPEPTPPVVEQP